jgi:DNA-binding NtrC family response regulator
MDTLEAQGTLLIVDDEPDLLEIMVEALGELTPNILVAENGKCALEIIRSHNIHTVVSDINMPVMSGLELLEALQNESITVPVIFVTATRDLSLVEATKRLGAFDYIEKPYDLDSFQAAVKRGLQLGLKQSKQNSIFRRVEKLELTSRAA